MFVYITGRRMTTTVAHIIRRTQMDCCGEWPSLFVCYELVVQVCRRHQSFGDTDFELIDDFLHIQDWTNANGMVINIHKTNEIVLQRPHPSR